MEDKICPMLECKECIFWRPFDMKSKDTGEVKRKMRCGVDILLEYIPRIIGAVDGCQAAANESRNYVITLARGLKYHGVDEPWNLLQRHEGVKDIGELGSREVSRITE